MNGWEPYWRSLGDGGTPLVVVHGGFGTVEASGDVLDRLATRRRVVAIELQGTAAPATSTARPPGTHRPTTSPRSCGTSTSARPT